MKGAVRGPFSESLRNILPRRTPFEHPSQVQVPDFALESNGVRIGTIIAAPPPEGGAMDSPNVIWIVMAVLVVVAVAAVAWFYMQRQRRVRLQERFGPEYDRTVREVGTPEKAEAVLDARARRVEKLKIRPLSHEQLESFSRAWRGVQGLFVDTPDGAVAAADRLVTEVMAARGYPVEDFDTRAADLSVDHPRVVENYRIARDLAQRREQGEAGTEELRQAVVNYRALFNDLLEVHDMRRAS
jgi:hypothetical protein